MKNHWLKEESYVFNFSNGSTLKGKFESIFLLIHKINKNNKIDYIKGHPKATALFEAATSNPPFNDIYPNRGVLCYTLRMGGFAVGAVTSQIPIYKSKDIEEIELVLNMADGTIRKIKYTGLDS